MSEDCSASHRLSPSPDSLACWDREHVWHAFTQMAEYAPLIIREAQGCYLVDLQGRRLLDGVSSLWCNVHGHQHPTLTRAIEQQLRRVAHVTSLGMSNPPAIELARKLVEVTPTGLNHVFYSSDGSSAVEVALKMAFQYWRQKPVPDPKRTKYLAMDQAYHGDTLGSTSVGGVPRFHAMFGPLLFDVIRFPTPSCYRMPADAESEALDAGDQDQLASYYANRLRQTLEAHHHELAAVVIEPLVQCAAGMVTHPVGLLREVRALCTEFDVLLIADEVAVGFGRTGRLFACEHEGVSPDFLCLGKGLTGGYLPMAATLMTDTIWEAFLGEYRESKSFFHGHTFSGNPLCAAAALASLEIFETEQTLENVHARAEQLATLLAPLRDHPHVGDIRQRGLLAGIELVKDRQTREPMAWEERVGQRICDAALRDGVWLRPLGNVLVIMPPLCISADELRQIAEVVRRAIGECLAS